MPIVDFFPGRVCQAVRLVGAILLSGLCPVVAQTPQWIWHSNGTPGPGATSVYFRKSFRTPPLLWNARLTGTADDGAEIFLNGLLVARCDRWDRPIRAEVTVRLNQGENVLGVRAWNTNGLAGLLVQLGLGGETNVITDDTWLTSTNAAPGWNTLGFDAAPWQPVQLLGTHGMEPWGDVLFRSAATAAEGLTVPAGFKVELLRSAASDEGSWICLAFDPKGRLTIASEGDKRPLLRVSFSNRQVSQVEPIAAPVHYAMGLLYAYDSLYANARGPDGAGLYRLVDANQNDQFDPDELKLLKSFEGGSEHGYHAVRLGPDGRIYLVNGNGTKLPRGLRKDSAFQHYGQDVLSLNPDETLEAGTERAAQCHVLRTDADGKEWELWAGGMRNAYAFDFSPEGELFTFDSDMEWDWGTPWYRPTRVLHLVAGGDYGWRDGTRTWPEYYEDSLPAVVDVGIGSPTGVRFGTRSRFPTKYQNGMFLLDWSYGRILFVQLEPLGASYRGAFEPFLAGAPLNLTDADFGPDGALYFITGGRGTQSGLYRVTYEGPVTSSRPLAGTVGGSAAERHRLEGISAHADDGEMAFIWSRLGSEDRALRFSARLALERQPVERWESRATQGDYSLAQLMALLALARVGPAEVGGRFWSALERAPFETLPEWQKLLFLRVLEVRWARHRPRAELALERLRERLDRAYPAAQWPLNRELSRVLLCLDAPGAVRKTVQLLAAAPTQEEQFHYVAQLRNATNGWSIADRRQYLEWFLKPRSGITRPPELVRWFADVGRSYVDGAWVDKYLREFRADALATMTAAERKQLAELVEAPLQRAQLLPSSNRGFVRAWALAELVPSLEKLTTERNLSRGRQAFVDSQCVTCHRFRADGGSVGPELTGVASKYDARSLLESIVEPSKVVSEQYQNVNVMLKSGESLTGRIVRENSETLIVETDPVSGGREKVLRSDVESIAPSALSPMPEGLINILDREEILDLIAFLRSGQELQGPSDGAPTSR